MQEGRKKPKSFDGLEDVRRILDGCIQQLFIAAEWIADEHSGPYTRDDTNESLMYIEWRKVFMEDYVSAGRKVRQYQWFRTFTGGYLNAHGVLDLITDRASQRSKIWCHFGLKDPGMQSGVTKNIRARILP